MEAFVPCLAVIGISVCHAVRLRSIPGRRACQVFDEVKFQFHQMKLSILQYRCFPSFDKAKQYKYNINIKRLCSDYKAVNSKTWREKWDAVFCFG